MAGYKPQEIEKKWQEKWAAQDLHNADLLDDSKPKYYNLVMFPYPSGDKLHIGHWYNYAPADSHGRFMRMKGYNVLQPMGYDSFGLPAENYAIKTGTPPAESIAQNTQKMTEQLSAIGAMWDWDKQVVTSTPEYYKWTQWVFLQLFKKDLAYQKTAPVNWCPDCQTVLANEQVQDGRCERCKKEVTKKDLKQWFFRITKYAEELLDHSELEWPQKTITMQKNWIGRSTGCDVAWQVDGQDITLETFTTTVDTLWGTTFVVISPEHPLVEKLVTEENKAAVEKYLAEARKKTDIDRMADGREKTGVPTGTFVVHPFTGKKVPLWIADYVLMNYGTGVVMGVPAHDQRDMDFAKKYGFEIIQTNENSDGETFVYDDVDKYTIKGKVINGGDFTGQDILEARKNITEKLAELGKGKARIQYKLHDWLISRQRYWGSPIPVVYDPEGNAHPVPEEHLPWTLPTDVEFKPTGESPLVNSKEFIERTEKIFGAGWRPEFDTMDTFMCSSWYYLRYPDPKNTEAAFSKESANKWLPVDMYIGGPEHACMHLLYARFLHHALHEMGYFDHKEPFKRLIHQGMITKDGAKMSKSKGNVVSPDSFVEKYGSDIFRMYLMFMGPFTEGGDWNDKGITGIKRFVDRFYKLLNSDAKVSDQDTLNFALHNCLKRVAQGIEKFNFNTAIAALMEFVNTVNKTGIDQNSKEIVTKAIAPLAPHLAEEIWEQLGHTESIFNERYPAHDEKFLVQDQIELVVQVNGKVRGKLQVGADISKDDALAAAKEIKNVQNFIEGKELVKEIFVPGKLVSFVVK